jgi:probable 2-oxoglutarate dehydrogenase E1 component DHKTD1
MTDSREAEGDTDCVNWEVVQPTTGAQYFHLLRRQMVRPWRKPLVVVAPKTLLRLPAAASSLADMAAGASFQTVIGDPAVAAPSKVEKVVFVSGRHYYTLAKHIEEKKLVGVAVVRLESLCPFPAGRLQEEVKRFPNAKKFIWSQEEHRNQGAWSFVRPRMEALVGVRLDYAGRAELCQSAVGVGQVHRAEAEDLLAQTFA